MKTISRECGVPDSGTEPETDLQRHDRSYADARDNVGQPFHDPSRRNVLVREGADALLSPADESQR